MKAYRDPFGNPLSKKDVTMAIQATCMAGDNISYLSLSRSTGLGLGKAISLTKLLIDAKIVTKDHKVLFKGFNNHATAVNAALRQLKKGQK